MSRLVFLCTIGLLLFSIGCSTTKPVEESFSLLPAEENARETEAREIKEALLALSRVHFSIDSDVLPMESRNALADAASKLVKYPDVQIYVEGHADHRGADEYNISLGEGRAKSTSKYLAHLGVHKSRLHILSYGEERPLDEAATAVAMAKNRRVEFRLMRGNVHLIIKDGMLINDLGGAMLTASIDHQPAIYDVQF